VVSVEGETGDLGELRVGRMLGDVHLGLYACCVVWFGLV